MAPARQLIGRGIYDENSYFEPSDTQEAKEQLSRLAKAHTLSAPAFLHYPAGVPSNRGLPKFAQCLIIQT